MEGEGPHVKLLPHHSFCTDCKSEWANEMRAAGLCRHPEAVEHRDADGIYMRRPIVERLVRARNVIPIRQVAVAA